MVIGIFAQPGFPIKWNTKVTITRLGRAGKSTHYRALLHPQVSGYTDFGPSVADT